MYSMCYFYEFMCITVSTVLPLKSVMLNVVVSYNLFDYNHFFKSFIQFPIFLFYINTEIAYMHSIMRLITINQVCDQAL